MLRAHAPKSGFLTHTKFDILFYENRIVHFVFCWQRYFVSPYFHNRSIKRRFINYIVYIIQIYVMYVRETGNASSLVRLT